MEEERVTIYPNDKSNKIIHKEDDMTCEVFLSKRGIYEGIIETMYSTGRYIIRLTNKIEGV